MILASTLSASFALGLAAALAYAVPALGSGLRPRASTMNPRLAELSLVIACALHVRLRQRAARLAAAASA